MVYPPNITFSCILKIALLKQNQIAIFFLHISRHLCSLHLRFDLADISLSCTRAWRHLFELCSFRSFPYISFSNVPGVLWYILSLRYHGEKCLHVLWSHQLVPVYHSTEKLLLDFANLDQGRLLFKNVKMDKLEKSYN